jgi:hypothetical protein
MARLRFGGSRWGRRNEPFNQNQVYIQAKSPMQKALVGVVMLLIGSYIFYTGELGVGEYSDFELTDCRRCSSADCSSSRASISP